MLSFVCKQQRKAQSLTTWPPLPGSAKQGVGSREAPEHCCVGFWRGYGMIPVRACQRVALFTAPPVCG